MRTERVRKLRQAHRRFAEDIVAGQVRHAAEDKSVQLVERAEVEAQVAAPRDVIKNIRH